MIVRDPQPKPRPAHRTRAIEYPVSDGEPLGETQTHIRLLFWLLDVLGHHLRDREYHCGSSQFFYYREGDLTASFAPDFYVLGEPPGHRMDCYKFWEHNNRPPIFVLEATSAKTRRQDRVTKRSLYRRLGVAEYFLFDPIGGLLTPRLQGLRLTGTRYVPIAAGDGGSLLSEQLNVRFAACEDWLELRDATTGQRLLSGWEAQAAAAQAAQAANVAAQAAAQAAQAAAQAANARIAELEASLARHCAAPPEKPAPDAQ